MKVLVIGAGGREHALAWKIKQSKKVDKLYCAPGNAGIAKEAECVPMAADDVASLVKLAKGKAMDLVVIGPEAPLTLGLTDMLEKEGILVFGCGKAAAELEGSKVFAKELMKKYHIPTASFGVFEDPSLAKDYVRDRKGQQVVKADGLAAGKGVIVCSSKGEAIKAIEDIMEKRVFGDAGKRVVIEKRLTGEEASFLAFTDGETVLPLASCQDHKAIFDDDKGPNTGGMGAYSPAPVVTRQLHDRIMKDVMIPTVKAMKAEGKPYKGVLYAGIMITETGIEVLEFNARFGDPETQPLLFRMKSDIVDLLIACAKSDGSLAKMKIEWHPDPAVCVVMASAGYPGHYDKGLEIHGLDKASKLDKTYVFHAGTSLKDGKTITAGGRVLGVTARGQDIPSAIEAAYAAVKTISWKGAYFRTDIGKKALKRCG
jgi:phosphoribosylamine--glycine ligase